MTAFRSLAARAAFRSLAALAAFRSLAALLMAGLLAAALPNAQARAALTVPGCPELEAWALGFTPEMWSLNGLAKRELPEIFAREETAKLFGQPLTRWSEADAANLRRALIDCRKAAREPDAKKALSAVASHLAGRVTNLAKALPPAREAVQSGFDALESAPPSMQLLRFYSLLSQVTQPGAYQALNQAAGQLQGQAQVARRLVAGLRDLPEAELKEAVEVRAAAKAEALRSDVGKELLAQIAAIPASLPGLDQARQAEARLQRDYAEALGPDQLAAAQSALAARRVQIGEEIASIIVIQVGQSSEGFDAYQDIEKRSTPQVLPHLPAPLAEKVVAAVEARRLAVGETLTAQTAAKLEALEETQESLDLIDRQLRPLLAALPAGAGDAKQKMEALAAKRRAEILEEVNEEEEGRLRGRTYRSDGGTLKLEFVDKSRVFATQGEVTAAGTYSEEDDNRLVLTLNGQSLVLRREGRRLEGWQESLLRIE